MANRIALSALKHSKQGIEQVKEHSREARLASVSSKGLPNSSASSTVASPSGDDPLGEPPLTKEEIEGLEWKPLP